MSERKNPCRLHMSPGGCRFGNRCKYSHDINRRNSSPPPSIPPGSPRPTSRNDRGQGDNIPRGVCNFYWKVGECNRGFECTFRHSRTPSSPSDHDTQSSSLVDEDAANVALDFFTIDGFADVAGVARHGDHKLNPADAHNHIKRYLRDDYKFTSPSDMLSFVNILASINRRNKTWNSDTAQEFLDMVVRGNALARIHDVLKFRNVSSSAGTGFNRLSFQLGYFAILEYLTSDLVLKTTLHHNINAIYTTIESNYQHIHENLIVCLQQMMDAKSWRDRTPGLPPSHQRPITGVSVFKTVVVLILQLFSRFKHAIRDHPELFELVNSVFNWFGVWSRDISRDPSPFEDPILESDASSRKLMIEHLRDDLTHLQTIVSREHKAMESSRKPMTKPTLSHAHKQEALLTRVKQSYDPPGILRPEGRRHDNDFDKISDIRIAPTNDELMCPIPPYLPINIPDSPHHYPPNSVERHLDIQFRLLREDLTFPIRESLTIINNDLASLWRANQAHKRALTPLEELLVKKGGLYRGSGDNSVMFHVYTHAEFSPVKAERSGLTVGLFLDSPPGAAREPQRRKREEYWKHAGSNKLASGSLTVLVLVDRGQITAHLGTLVSSNEEIAESSKASEDKIQVRATFFDAEIELRALRRERISIDQATFAFLIDNNVMFESVRPFLKTLQEIEPTTIPFSRYITQNGGLRNVCIRPPKYATTPSFTYNLECLARPREYIHPLRVTDKNSVTRARLQLKQYSDLDPSQCDSVIDALTREVSLIQGPPGTGKSFTAKEILRVLFANKIKPIVLMAYTNHALDLILTSILDAKITDKLVRLGSRTSDERIAEYNIGALEKFANSSSRNRSVGREFAVKKKLEERMRLVMENIQIPHLTGGRISEYLEDHYPEHLEWIAAPPFWIRELFQQMRKAEDSNEPGEQWKVVSKANKNSSDHEMNLTFYGFWKSGFDIDFIQPPQIPLPSDSAGVKQDKNNNNKKKQPGVSPLNPKEIQTVFAEYQERLANFFGPLGFANQIPPQPSGNRPLTDLLHPEARVWNMSRYERSQLAMYWEDEMRKEAYMVHVGEYQALRTEYEQACTRFNDVKDESRRRLLSQTDLIGCTTTGAAKLISLLTNIGPRVLMIEEAGQVLEAHILAALVPSVQHMICIGDPQQLRPSLATYSLSVENPRGRELFKFDQSLMERLSENGMPMSQINVQRRMRPSISHNIRTILYPGLVDHNSVLDYPHVQGMEKDVYFFTHTNKEDSAQDSGTKVNTFEVEMIVDLVVYLLRQERYNSEGAIAVLCAYLGQLQKVRAALRSLKVSVAVDERDEENIVKQGLEDENTFEAISVDKQIRLGTVDNFQGLEANLVIVSLVRNSGTFDTTSSSIGFLKSANRINVALSRAKHGLYIMGNASNLRKNPTWSTIIDEMEQRDQIGFGFPTVCPRHPEQKRLINKPGQLSTQAPYGGCLLSCNYRLACGHNCPSLCHADRDNHRSTKCNKPCTRLACIHSHPCRKRCWEDCGKCEHPIYNVKLPCRHEAASVPCYQMEVLDSVKCDKPVDKRLLYCEHHATIACHKDPSTFTCLALCDGPMSCCSKKCKSRCSDCQKVNLDVSSKRRVAIMRTQHQAHSCERPLYCEHLCGLPCAKDHECSTECKQACRQRCDHHQCKKMCSESCAPCMELCAWRCAHAECPVSCGSICSRLPCDEICNRKLKCGHLCPSVCGEPCDKQKCIVCLPSNEKTDIVDFIMQRSLSEIDLMSQDVSERLITLNCGHIFTVETLDGHCHMKEYYDVDSMERYIAPKAPPINFQKPPTCPTCRGPITALRYGRITKRANLDILEQNIASNMSQSLEKLAPILVNINTNLVAIEKSAKDLKYDPDFTPAEKFDDLALARDRSFGNQDEPLGPHVLNALAMRKIHGIASREGLAWQGIVKELLTAYKEVVGIAKTRPAHVRAYQAALSTLYRLELAEIAEDPLRASDHPEPLAIEAVNRKIGQPPPKADRRYHVEAFLLSIELRFMLAQAARARVDALPVTSNDQNVLHHRRLWSSFVEFIYSSCIIDSEKTIAIASSSSAYRKAARASIMKLRSDFEKFRFEMIDRRSQLYKTEKLMQERSKLLSEIQVQKASANEFLRKVEISFRRSQRSISDIKVLQEEQKWFNENCGSKVKRILQEYDELHKHIKTDGFYQPMTLQEREDIVKALGFSHRGHFYNCANGHTFVITECGGAMESARCPECRAPIGGSHHNLDSSNTRAMEFEEIAGKQGAHTSPWAWARGV